MSARKTVIFVPTYNEHENVERLCKEILALGLDVDLVFMDDNSPDGTGRLLDRLAAEQKRVKTLHRRGKLGIGSAHQDGIRWAYDNGYSVLVTMDADFTHSPKYIPDFIAASRDYDVVVGSRYRQKKSLREWNLFRKTLTIVGHFLTHTLLGMEYDATGAYRLYRLDRIPREAFDRVRSKGYSFFFESLHVLNFNRFSIKEVPILLPARTYGHSKMSYTEILRSVRFLVDVWWRTAFRRETLRVPLNLRPAVGGPQDPQGWDGYWSSKVGTSGRLYDIIAAVYRTLIIKPALRHFALKRFPEGAKVLHAGCGSGQLDRAIASHVEVTGLDISPIALSLYKRNTRGACEAKLGSVFALPFDDASFDGIFNLGVMEHFTEDEIRKILGEFARVLRPGGKAVLFWPPEFGISVFALRAIHFVLNDVFRRGVRLHPDEITRLRSSRHAREICSPSGLRVLDCYFGPRDFFTHMVVVLAKPDARNPGRVSVWAGA